jgi:hypothetical protein
MKTDMKEFSWVLSIVLTAGLGSAACDTPEQASDEVSLRSDTPPACRSTSAA